MRSLSFSLVFLLCGVVQWLSVSGGLALTINLHNGSTVYINRRKTAQSNCDVCIGKTCQSFVTLRRNAEVEFKCPQPEDIFAVEIVKYIECTSTCNGTITPEEYPSLQNFSRTFTWNVKVLIQKSVSLDLTQAGLRQIRPTDSCQDKHVYTISTGTNTVGRFCRHGVIKGMQLLYEGSISLQVPGKEQINAPAFGVSVGDEITLLAIISVSLPEEKSAQEFFSPNYPDSFPDDDLVTWSFHVPPMYYVTMRILNYTEPKCRRKDTRLEYELKGRTMVKKLKEAQLSEHRGPFNLSLQNCKMVEMSSLSLHYQISAVKRNSEVRCTVNLKKEEELEIHLKKKKPDSACILKLNSLLQEAVTISTVGASYLSFVDCSEEDLLLNVNQNIACRQQNGCSSSEFSLRVPVLEKCVLGVLQQVAWHLYVPKHGAVELMSPMGSLLQSLPGQTCNSSVLLTVTEQEHPGITVGQFCPQGHIQKVQIRSNITVTATPADGQDLRAMTSALLKGSFLETITESYIFTVLPKTDTSVLLATPAWPAGMRTHSTVSWDIAFPSQFEAQVEFTNVSQVRCSTRHTCIKLQKRGSRSETHSWRMDEKPNDVVVEESFYLNMSNCRPVNGAFGVVSQITLLKRNNRLLSIILSVVSVLLVLMVVVLAVVCFINRKKKKQKAPDVSVYNPNGHAFLPGLHGIPQTREDEDFHVYHCIDDTMVYGHLLKEEREMNQFKPAVDSYQAFTGPTDAQPLTEQREDTEVGVYRPFTAPINAPEVPHRSPGQGGNPASGDQQIADKEIIGDCPTPDLKRAPVAEPEEDDSELKL